MKVKQIMHKAIVVEGDINLKAAAGIMSKRNIGSLVVIKKNKIVGIITERDIMRNVNRLNSKLSSVMSKKVITIDEGESINNAALLMSKHKIKRLPVIKNGKLAGMITATDLVGNADELGENFFFE